MVTVAQISPLGQDDLAPLDEALTEYLYKREETLRNEVFRWIPTRGMLLALVRDLESLGDKYACAIVNGEKPPIAPDVSGPRTPGCECDIWRVDGWTVFRDYRTGRVTWQGPDEATYELQGDIHTFLPADIAQLDRDLDDKDWLNGWPTEKAAALPGTGGEPR